MTAHDILREIEPLGTDSYKKVLLNHGVAEPVFGVKIEDMKKIVKRVKKDYQLALDLYDTGVYDARYLAGLIADDAKMTKKDLKHWLAGVNCDALATYTVPWVASGSPHGPPQARDEWIESKKEYAATAGWATLTSHAAITPDAGLDIEGLRKLLKRVAKTIHDQPNRVRFVMNSFVIGIGSYVAPLTAAALEAAAQMGPVTVDMGDTACKVPAAAEYIKKVQARGTIGKKRMSAKC